MVQPKHRPDRQLVTGVELNPSGLVGPPAPTSGRLTVRCVRPTEAMTSAICLADPPQIEGATGRFVLQQMVAVAELEAGLISARAKAALAAAKRGGKKLGGDRGLKPVQSSPDSRSASCTEARGRSRS